MYGARGEALYSMVALCDKVIITSRAQGSDRTYCKVIDRGRSGGRGGGGDGGGVRATVSCVDTGIDTGTGTTVTLRGIFQGHAQCAVRLQVR